MMIRNFLILTILAALVPTAMSNVSPFADAEIALFSGVSDSDGLSISGNGDTAKMELKVTNDNGKSNRVPDFQLTADNVLSTEVGDKVTVKDNVDFTKAVTTDARDNQKAIGITSNGVIDLVGYDQGVYTLDVVVDDDRAYEAIITIGDQTNHVVDKEITRVNNDCTWKFVIDYDCDNGYHYDNGKCVPDKPTPIPSPVPCPESDPNCEPPVPCPESDPNCEPQPIIPVDPVDPVDQVDPVDPCSIEPTGPDCETPEEPVVLPLVGENTVEIPNEPVEEELLEEEQTEEEEQEQNEGFTGEEEEVEEESSEQEESGESEGEDSGEESEGESEEESDGGI